MASRVNRPHGHRWIQFTDTSGRRQTIRLGKMTPRNADAIKARVESLLSSKLVGCMVDEDTARWLVSATPALVAKLAAVGLIEKRMATTVGELVEYSKQHLKHKSTTDTNEHRYTQGHLLKFFKAKKLLHLVTPADAQQFFAWLRDDEGAMLAASTAGKRFEKSSRYFQTAVDKRWLTENPLTGIKTKSKAPRDRDENIDLATIDRVIAEARDPRFRLVVALCRFGGMRTPSEPLALRWEWFNWEEETLTFRATKTSNWRTIPLFHELRPFIDEAWQSAGEGAEMVFGDWKPNGSAITHRLNRILRRLGVEPWLKPWQNMRATRETELAERFPEHVVCAWMGHSKTVAREHYLRVTKEHVSRATKPEADSEALSATNATRTPQCEAKPEAP